MKHQARNAAKKNVVTSRNLAAANTAANGPQASQHKRLAANVARRSRQSGKSANSIKGALTTAVLETLENRQLLSSTMNVADGVLQLTADPQTSSRILVHLSRDGQQVTASINGHDERFDLTNLKGIAITGSAQDDLIRVSSRITLPSTIHGGAGNDRIYGGGGNDSIETGDGNDYVDGRGGNDSIVGGGGQDTLIGGSGNDSIRGGAGKDLIYGGTGNDSLVSGTGVDTLWGGAGNDTLDGSTGVDVIAPQAGTDRIVRGPHNKIHGHQRDIIVAAGNGTSTPGVGDANSGSSGGASTGADNSNSGSAGSGSSTSGSGSSTSGSGTSASGSGNTSGSGGSTSDTGTSSTGSTSGSGLSNTGGTGSSNTGTSNKGSTGGGSSTPTSDPGVGGTTQNGNTESTDFNGTDGNIGLNRTTGKLKANIQFIEATGMAGHAVHVNGLGSTLSAGDYLSTNYSWDFGDSGSRFNTLVGWTAGHIYDTPGTYTVTLTVTDSTGNSSVAKGKVTITADTRNVIYVDNNGSDGNTGATPQTAVASAARAVQLAGDNTTILFHNGQVFDVSDGLNVSNSNVTFSAYGSGAAAELRKVTGTGSSILDVNAGANDVMVENLIFNSMWTIETYGDQTVPARGIYVSGDNFSVRNCEFYNVDDAINTAGRPTGVIVQDNYFGTSIRGNCIWGEGFDHVYIGNTFTNSTQEHLIRCADTGVTRLLIEQNNFSRPDNNKGSLELRTAQWFYVRGNIIVGGTLRMGLPNGVLPDSDAVAYGVVEGNETYNIFVNFRPGASHISFRDNVINYDDGVAIQVETKYADIPRLTQDLRFDHNTVVSNSVQAIFLQLDGPAKDLSVTNNLMVAPHLTFVGEHAAAVYIGGTDLSSFTTISDNIWPQLSATTSQVGINYMYSQLYDAQHGFIPTLQWQSYSQVHDEQYDNVDLSGDVYSVKLNGMTAGATSDIFNPNAWDVAVKQAA